MKKYQLAGLFWLITSVHAQSLVDVKTQTKNVDFSGAASTIPAKSGTTLPATCNAGEMFFKTNNSPGQNLYSCAPANTWTQIASSSNGTVSMATSGQFGFYAGSGNTIIGHTLTASDIPALNYQSPLVFTGSGAKTATSIGTLSANDCAKWDPSGNIIDAGSTCATIATGTAGQFGFYSANGTTITPHTLVASDIPALNYQSPITFTGNGNKAVTATGNLTASDCAKWDASGNIIDAGAPCATVAAGSAGQFVIYPTSGSTLTFHSLTASDIPALNYQTPLSFTGTGTKTISSTGPGVSNNCAKWDASGNVVDAGSPCGTGSGSGGITSPSTTTTGNVPQFSNTSGTALSTGLGVVTAIGSPGSDSNIPTEKSVRSAIASYGAITSSSATGTGTKFASALSAGTSNNCAKWDANGNIIDSGAPCASGNFASLTGGTNTAGSFVVGTGASISTTGTGTISATSVPASGVTGLAASATTDTTNASNISTGTLSAARLPTSVVTTSSATGTASKYVTATAAGTSNNCVKWDASGNIVDAGAPCGSGNFALLTGGTNTAGSFVVGTGASIAASGTGTIAATSVPASGVSGLAASATTDTTNASNISSGTLSAARLPASVVTTSSATGTAPKYVTATAAGTSNNCAKWDASGNMVDAGAPCGSGNFASLTGGTNAAGSFVVGTGASIAASGTGTIAATSVPASGVSGLAASATTDATNAANISSGTLSAARLPTSVVTTSSATGTASKYVSASGAGVSNNCVKWDANGNIVDAGAPCGSGSGGSTLSTPSTTTVSNIPQYSNTTGSALSAGLGFVTTLGNPGLDTNIPSEKAIRTAIAAASVASGSLPAQNGSAGFLVSNGTTANWGDLTTGPSGALCAGTGCSGGTPGIVDIVTSVIPRLAAANTFTGVNKFQQLQVSIYSVATLPTCNSGMEGQMEGVSDAVSPSYLATVTGGGSVHVPVYCNGTSWVAH